MGSAVTKAVSGSADPTIVNPARLDHRGASRVCGQCHSTFLSPDQQDYLANGYRYRPGDDLSTAFQTVLADSPLHTPMEQLGKPVYWTDGACWVAAASTSDMSTRNVTPWERCPVCHVIRCTMRRLTTS
ncbi:MAG: hypothetical protein CM1200mP2_30460 [Planctomycetaceae bacterium]|nr:MAG: hypothetical protein CM1200mP2_30460 [Planctomycetaceae bacterium]